MIASRFVVTGRPVHRGRNKLLASLAGVMLAVGSTAIQAHAGVELHTVTVSYADLDISKPAGRDSLYRRIHAAARTVCGQRDKGLDLRHKWRQCYDSAVATALASLDESVLPAR